MSGVRRAARAPAALRAIAVASALLGPGTTAGAASDPGAECTASARAAAARHEVPPTLLAAIAATESGRTHRGRFGPWPWTLNVAGEGRWFETRAEALAEARRLVAGGTTSFDLGCFQINFRWHGEAFASLEAMLTPASAADYAARFLRRLFEESGNWLVAASHYHSRTPEFAARYRSRVEAMLAHLDAGTADSVAPLPVAAAAAPPAIAPPASAGSLFATGARAARTAWPASSPLMRGDDSSGTAFLSAGRGSVIAGPGRALIPAGARRALIPLKGS